MPYFCFDCHELLVQSDTTGCGTGHATLHDPTEARICYPCADTRTRMDMRKTDTVFAYLAKNGRHVTTWTGGELARVLSVSPPRNSGFGRRLYVRAIDPTGQRWHGSGPADSGKYVRLTKTKGGK